MNRKIKMHKVFACFLTALLLVASATEWMGTMESVSAATFSTGVRQAFLENASEKTGKMPQLAQKIDFDKYGVKEFHATEADVEAAVPMAMKGSAVYNYSWDVYSTNYYYNLMNEEQQAFWDSLDTMCIRYLTGMDNMNAYSVGWCFTDYVDCSLTMSEMQLIAALFKYSNPQYYFLYSVAYMQTGESLKAAFFCYDAFSNGVNRAAATASFKNKADQLVSQVSGYTREYDKAKAVHDLICNNVNYNYASLGANGLPSLDLEPTYFTQSAYSALCLGSTVCAGYAHAYEMICNAIGLDTICVTSSSHEWNKSYVNGSWYNVDCTWDDYDTGFYYICFLRSDAETSKVDTTGAHVAENYYTTIQPVCSQDTGSSYFKTGVLPVSNGQIAPVTIQVAPFYVEDMDSTSYQAAYTVTMECADPQAAIYFTIDGTQPSVASTKCFRYTNSFTITHADSIVAVAYKDNYTVSAASVDNTCVPITYQIRYTLNGGKNTSANPGTYTVVSENISLKEASKKGYKFAGWYADSTLKTKVKEIPTGTYGNLDIYAKWTPIKYKVKFNANGGKGKMSTITCKYGTAKKLKACTMKKAGYKFMGWSTTKNGKVKYKNKASIKNLSSKNGKTVTLYAVWKKV